ncbi:MAG: diaminopimelate epimerase [Eubacterium sp.]|nr:diaminopimelate epimerase [Eubacterium sp.]
MKFTKMHGTGNDYIYINLFPGYDDSVDATYDDNGKLLTVDGRPVDEVAREVSDRHFGIGSDGLIAIAPSDMADARMIMFNLDGSEGAMCGNGIRCVAKYVYDKGLVTTDVISIETASGIRELELTIEDGVCKYVSVNMGQAILTPKDIPVDLSEINLTGINSSDSKAPEHAVFSGDKIVDCPLDVAGSTYRVTCVSMGNPHCVIFTEGIDDLDLEKVGPLFEKNKAFPEQVNTEFVEVVDDHTVRMRVWERGSGETMSCGTGTCAVTVASVLNGYVKRGTEVEVQIRGGKLYDTWLESGEVRMRGPATTVFVGEY